MICFDRLWDKMRAMEITKYRLIDCYGIDSHTIQRLRENRSVTTATLNKLCEILGCRVEDIMEYKPDEPPIFDKLITKPVPYRRVCRKKKEKP